MEAIERRTDISACFCSRTDAASRQETTRYRTDIQLGKSCFMFQLICIQYSVVSIQCSDGSHPPPAIAAVLRGNGGVSR